MSYTPITTGATELDLSTVSSGNPRTLHLSINPPTQGGSISAVTAVENGFQLYTLPLFANGGDGSLWFAVEQPRTLFLGDGTSINMNYTAVRVSPTGESEATMAQNDSGNDVMCTAGWFAAAAKDAKIPGKGR